MALTQNTLKTVMQFLAVLISACLVVLAFVIKNNREADWERQFELQRIIYPIMDRENEYHDIHGAYVFTDDFTTYNKELDFDLLNQGITFKHYKKFKISPSNEGLTYDISIPGPGKNEMHVYIVPQYGQIYIEEGYKAPFLRVTEGSSTQRIHNV
jgi:hypothetical protein